MADTGSASHHEELALLYESIGKTEAALTYRIAAAHTAKTVTCFESAAKNLEAGLSHCAAHTALHARLLIRLADINLLRNRNPEARKNVSESIRIAKKARSLKLEADAKYTMARLETMEGALAEVYLSTGAHSLARAAARKVIVLAEPQGPSSILGDANRLAGFCAANQGDQNEAERYFAEATGIGEQCKDELLKARTLADRGDSEVIKKPAKAEALWREARSIFCRLGENSQVLRLDRSLVRHTFEHASRPLRYSEAV